jgi:soluble lytic murein transglycosylase-like protein
MSRRLHVFVVAAMGVGFLLAGLVFARHVIAVASEENAGRLSLAILQYVVRRNPEAPVAIFRYYPEVLLAEARLTSIDHCLALAQAEVESEFKPEAVGAAGEIGLYQILPSTAAMLEPVAGRFKRPAYARGRRDLGDLANPLVNTHFAMAYLRDIMSRKPSIKEALTEYNGGPSGRHYHYYQRVMSTYVEILENAELRCRFQPVPQQPPSPVMVLLSRM